MANMIIGFPNLIDTAVLDEGAWNSSLPLPNIQTRPLARVARSQSAALAATKFGMDMTRQRTVRAAAIVNHNLSGGSKWRITGADVADFSTLGYDSGWLDVWPTIYEFGTVRWGESGWWSGQYTDEEKAGYTPIAVHIMPADEWLRYWRIEIDDAGNTAGYIQLGRVFIGPCWQPSYNLSYGHGLGWQTKTEVLEARSGAEYFYRRTPYRAFKFALDWLSRDETLAQAFELQRRAGIDAEVLAVIDPDDTVHAIRRQFLARLRELSLLEFPAYARGKSGFELKELL